MTPTEFLLVSARRNPPYKTLRLASLYLERSKAHLLESCPKKWRNTRKGRRRFLRSRLGQRLMDNVVRNLRDVMFFRTWAHLYGRALSSIQADVVDDTEGVQ